jgi:hypothetical protein
MVVGGVNDLTEVKTPAGYDRCGGHERSVGPDVASATVAFIIVTLTLALAVTAT